ncbi:MAG: hypothetical protein HUU38_07445 [Anaerolineales bacterium]|nr:hypothetical protein [Anaerolineales bacterium]
MTNSNEQLLSQLEGMIRRIVREELSRFAEERTGIFYLSPDSPLYEDLSDIAERKVSEKIQLYTHEEVWGE